MINGSPVVVWLLLAAPAAASQTLPIDGALCSHGLDSEGFPSGEFKIDANGYYDGYFAPSPNCEITKVEDIGDGWMLVEDACGDSFDLMFKVTQPPSFWRTATPTHSNAANSGAPTCRKSSGYIHRATIIVTSR